jgi:hypothetical protein
MGCTMVLKIPAGVFENIVDGENILALLDEGGKYERWFWASVNGGLWLMDMSFYKSPEYGSLKQQSLVVVCCIGAFPKYNRTTGKFVEDSVTFSFDGKPDPKLIKRFHGERVEIVGDTDV